MPQYKSFRKKNRYKTLKYSHKNKRKNSHKNKYRGGMPIRMVFNDSRAPSQLRPGVPLPLSNTPDDAGPQTRRHAEVTAMYAFLDQLEREHAQQNAPAIADIRERRLQQANAEALERTEAEALERAEAEALERAETEALERAEEALERRESRFMQPLKATKSTTPHSANARKIINRPRDYT